MKNSSHNAAGERIAGPEREQAVIAPMLLKLRDVEIRTGIDERTFLRYADAGLAPWGYKIGSLRRWRADELEAWIAGGCKPVRTVKGRV